MNEKELSKLVDDALVKCWMDGYLSNNIHRTYNPKARTKRIADELKKALGLVPIEDGGRVVD